MDFQPSAEQEMLADSVNVFGARHYPSSSRLKILAAGVDPMSARWSEMAGLGWLGLGLGQSSPTTHSPETDNYIMSLCEGFGRHLMLEPFVTRCVLAPALIEGGGGDAEALLPAIGDGSTAVSLAFGEPRAGFALHHVETVAAPHGSGFRITGVKDFAVDGADADWFVVPARTAGGTVDRDGISLLLVSKDAPGLRVERYRSIDNHRHARLKLTNVAVEGSALIGPRDGALPVLEAAVERAIVAHLAEALGSMDAVAAVTLDYLKTRMQFGKLIGSFQALQHRMVDINIACEEARSMVYHATANLSAEPEERGRAIAAAKARVGQCGLYTARQAVQLHGGLGLSAELIVSHHLKRQMMLDLQYGNAAHQRQRFAQITRIAA